jgi:hypothetical protein
VIGFFLAVELLLTAMAVAAAYVIPDVAAGLLRRFERFTRPLARRRRLAVLTVGVIALVVRAAILPVLPIPEPTVHDEFSYLLAADTFAHGRLTNPTHPMWMHFESFHINQKPTYASMYYPAQGLLLAAGQALFARPFVAVWLSVGVMGGAICWMLQGWMPPQWALLGGFLAILRLGTFSYWADSYYGGALAAIGGALVLGALPRIRRQRRLVDALLMGLGLAIIANTRPYEGLFFAIPIATALAAWLWGLPKPFLQISIRRVVLTILLVLITTAAGMGYYFWRVTGSPLRIPYQTNMETYGFLYFPWQQLKARPVFHHPVMQDFYDRYFVRQYESARSRPLEKAGLTAVSMWLFFLGPIFTLPFITWIATKRFISKKTLFFLSIILITAIGLLLPIYIPQPHYIAPLTPAIYFVILQAVRHSRLWRWNNRPSGRVIVMALPVICVAMFALRIALPVPAPATAESEFLRTWSSPRPINWERAELLDQLKNSPGRQLAIVRYKSDHDSLLEWVYNEADIDNAKVVWARETAVDEDRKLIEYFKDRQIRLVEADEKPPKLYPYGPDVPPR